VYRVVTDSRDHLRARILDKGPWLPSQKEADQWASLLQGLGYKVHVESNSGNAVASATDLQLTDALKNMA